MNYPYPGIVSLYVTCTRRRVQYLHIQLKYLMRHMYRYTSQLRLLSYIAECDQNNVVIVIAWLSSHTLLYMEINCVYIRMILISMWLYYRGERNL